MKRCCVGHYMGLAFWLAILLAGIAFGLGLLAKEALGYAAFAALGGAWMGEANYLKWRDY